MNSLENRRHKSKRNVKKKSFVKLKETISQSKVQQIDATPIDENNSDSNSTDIHIVEPISNVSNSSRNAKGVTRKKLKRSNSSTYSLDLNILYKKKTFVTCRNVNDSFYLCQILEDVYDDKENIRIRWCELVDQSDDKTEVDENTHFKFGAEDALDPHTILLRLDDLICHSDKTMSLRKKDIIQTNRLLKKSIKNELISSDSSENENAEIHKKSTKRRKKRLGDTTAPVKRRRGTKDINEIVTEDEGRGTTKSRKTKKIGPPSKAQLFKVRSNRFLNENVIVTKYDVDPFFEENVTVPFISSSVHSKLAIRAVILNDRKLLENLIKDVDRVCSVHIRRDFSKSLTAIHYAIRNNNLDLLEILLKDIETPKSNRCSFPSVTMQKQNTGNASIRTLGFRTAKIMASRGAREGNNALLKDSFDTIGRYDSTEILSFALRNNCSHGVLDLLRKSYRLSSLYNNVIECIQAGHRQLAVSILDELTNSSNCGFNELHRQVLSFTEEVLTVKSACDVIEKANGNSKITPIHCASINPNSKYLKQLLSIVPEFNISDENGRQPIHFAAACEGLEPLEYLLTQEVNLNAADKNGNSPLHVAATYGRANNVKTLLAKAKEKAESNHPDEQTIHEKFGLASINQMNQSKQYPLHLAVINNHLDCVKILLDYDALVDGFTSISKEKLTPLMFACQKGNLNIVVYLIEHGARVESRDRFKRTPLIHACMYGNAHIVSYLLRLGADPNVFDSSLNTALHYSIAYGWYFCVRLLIEAGANVNCVNCWQTTCLGLAFSKGHYGICDYLLTDLHVDINFKTDEGLTLVMITTELEISSSAVQQLEYIVIKHKADCTCVDIQGNNAFHYLAQNSTGKEEKDFCRMAQILLDNKCNPLQMNNKAQTPFMLALERKNIFLVEFFINEAKIELNSDVNSDGKTFLHYFSMNCDNEKLMKLLLNLPVTDELKKMGKMIDNQNRTPFHYCVNKYDEFCRRCAFNKRSEYESIIQMFRFCLETIECDPNLGIRLKTIDEETDGNDSTNKTNLNKIEQKLIFYLLRSSPYVNETDEQPLNIFLTKTNNINVLHHETQRTPLLEAIHLKQDRTINILLNHPSCDINLATSINQLECKQTPLIVACKLQYFSVIRNLLNNPKCDLLAYDFQNNQAFHYYLATSKRSDEYLEIFHLFIEKLKQIDKNILNNQGKLGRTPLHIAVYHNLGTVDFSNIVEQTLIENQCDPIIKDNLGNIPLHNVFLSRRNNDDPVEICVLICQSMKYQSLDTQNNDGNTPLYLAVTKACTVCIMFLLKHNANLLVENNSSTSIIGNCIVSNHLNLLITFLYQPIDIDLSKFYTKTNENLLSISRNNQRETTNAKEWKWKFAHKISKPKLIEQYSLIFLIIQRNWQGALSLILDELHRFHLTHIQVFEAAISNDKINLIFRFLSNIKDQTILNEKNSRGQNLFHLISKYQRYDNEHSEKILNYLHKYNVDWNIPDNYGSYPLHYASVIHNFSFIKFLQNKYSDQLDFNQTDSFGNTAYGLLFWSSTTKSSFNKDFLRKLITSGNSIDCLCNYYNQIALDPLSFNCPVSSSEDMISYPPDESENDSITIRTSPLINAIVRNHFELAKFLLELGANVNYSDENKKTPLMHAVLRNNTEMVKLLLNIDYSPDKDNQPFKLQVKQSMIGNRKAKSKGFFLGAKTTVLEISSDSSDSEEKRDQVETMDETDEFTMTSSIDLNLVDSSGRTAIHYLVEPFPKSSFLNNVELLKLLHKFGASLTKCDLTGRTPIEYSALNGCQHLYDLFVDLMGNEQIESIQLKVESFHVNDPNKSLLSLPDYYSDAQRFIEEYISDRSMETSNNICQIDPLSNMSQTGEIVIDTNKNNEPYDVRLTITDVDYGLIGLYNFYRMQIIKHKSKTNLYLLFTRWGRIGDGDGQHQLTPFSSLDECRQEFCKIFRTKTGNSWESTDHFEKKPKKYTLIQLNERQIHKHTDVPINFVDLQNEKQHLPSQLQSSVYKDFFRIFLNSEVIRENLLRTALDVEWMPISQLKPVTLQKARDVLNQLKFDIEKKEELKLKIQQTKCDEQNEDNENEDQKIINDEQRLEYKLLLDSICKNTNEFYSIVPQKGYGDEKLPMIDSEEAVKLQEQKLNDILELELSYKILLAAQANFNKISPLDYLYRSINCQFEAMNRDDLDSQFILRYIWASAPEIKVEQIFKIARANDDKGPFQPNIKNHYLLWHGTNVCNLMSILIRGLLVTPLCATATGSLFGKGIYTADAFKKSLGYCHGILQGNTRRYFMFLCEVALGNSQEINHFHGIKHSKDVINPNQYQSRKANGRQIPDPRYTITLSNDVRMPLGQLISCTDPIHGYHCCEYNEYIVFHESQIKLRYIIQFQQ